MAPKNRMLMDPNYPLWTGLEVLYVNDNGVVTCNLTCDDGEFLDTLGFRRATLAEFFTRYIEHLAAYHPYEYDQLKRELPNLLTQHRDNPTEQSHRGHVHVSYHRERGDQKADSSSDQQDQYDARHVDPLDLGRRFE